MHINPSPDAGAPGLPVQLSSFIGREQEIARLRQVLKTARLLTLTGAGGSGKTRLALEVAAQEAREYPDGIAWVELAALADPDLLSQQIAATLGIREEGGRSAAEVLLDALRHRSLLLFLDNCEHLADACAALADALLRGCPGLKFLATSREALGIAGERAWLVPPLSLPANGAELDLATLLDAEAVQLFVARAQDVVPSFTLREQNAAAVAQICRRLDGLPLAIELAAARVRVLTPEQIAERLDNAFALLTGGSRTALPRQRTLRATIDWSYQLLSGPEQLLLQRLSVFVGSFTLEAAESVCADERLAADDVLDLLTRLVDRSLVVMREHAGAARYHLLETVRQYAAERFAPATDAWATLQRHAAFYLDFAEAAEPHVYMGGTSSTWLHRLDAEIGNIRAAADWFGGDDAGAEAGLRLATSLRWYWYQRETAEGRRQIDRALARGGTHSPQVRSRALLALGTIAFWQGDIVAMQEPLADAIALARELRDDHVLAEARNWQALGLTMLGELDRAGSAVEEALSLARRIGGPLLVQVTSSAGYISHRRGDLTVARELAEAATELARSLGLDWAGLTISINLARLAYVQGDLESAAMHWHKGLGLDVELHQRWAAPFGVEGLALLAFARNEAQTAARLLGGAEVVRETIGTTLRPFDDGPIIEQIRAALGEAAFETALAEGRAMSMAQVIQLAAEVAERAAGATPRSPVAVVAPDAVVAAPPHEATAASAAPPALRVLALGPLEIYRDGELLSGDVWRYTRPKELLLYLLAHPEGRTREQIGLIFWPDSSPAQVKNSFHVTLHHLRKALGYADWIVFENERYQLSPALAVEFDAALFEERITAALREVRAGSDTLTPERLASVLALYRGGFLEDEACGDWHLELRDHLQRLWLEGMLALGELLVQAERWTEGAEVYQRIVRREDLHEEAHRRLMLCLARTGERAKALRHYERLVVLLREELDAAPEEETNELFERLRQAEPV